MSTETKKYTNKKNFAVEEMLFIIAIVVIVIAVLYIQSVNDTKLQTENNTINQSIINYTARLSGQSEFCYNMYIPEDEYKFKWNISDPYMTTAFQDDYWMTTHRVTVENITFDILIKTKCFPQFNWSSYE